ncbi:MAG TPA: hypothetical protein VFS66_06660 [Acidimicrobiia bacterium]|nr:hypothetical protein [Acidimicrobiia bacterium]
MLWIRGYWVDGPVDASHELMEYELGRRAMNDLLHQDQVLFDVFI